jgi:hypothetical protein
MRLVVPFLDDPQNRPPMYNYWARGNVHRLLLNCKVFPNDLKCVVPCGTVDEIRRAVRLLMFVVDYLIVVWTGPETAGGAFMSVPVDYQGAGGGGHILACADRSRNSYHEYFPAFGEGHFFPEDLLTFVADEARDLVATGRLAVLSGPGIGWTPSSRGVVLSYLRQHCGIVPVLGGRLDEGQSLGLLPYAPTIEMPRIAEVMDKHEQSLVHLRQILFQRMREAGTRGDDASRRIERELRDGLRELRSIHERTNGPPAEERVQSARGQDRLLSAALPLLGFDSLGLQWAITNEQAAFVAQAAPATVFPMVGDWLRDGHGDRPGILVLEKGDSTA